MKRIDKFNFTIFDRLLGYWYWFLPLWLDNVVLIGDYVVPWEKFPLTLFHTPYKVEIFTTLFILLLSTIVQEFPNIDICPKMHWMFCSNVQTYSIGIWTRLLSQSLTKQTIQLISVILTNHESSVFDNKTWYNSLIRYVTGFLV